MNILVGYGIILFAVFLPLFIPESYAYGIKNPPVHQYIAREATKVWADIPQEILNHASRDINSSLDRICRANLDAGDDIIIGSGEEDQEENPFFCDPFERCTTNGGRNGYFEHFWDPDFPNTGGYNCNALNRGKYNQGLIIDIPLVDDPPEGYDSAYRLAQNYWDSKIIPFYKEGRIEEAYYWLGRVAHLLSDITVPAHVHLLPHDPFVGENDWFEHYFNKHSERIEKYLGKDFFDQEYKFECLPNLPCNFNWKEVHPNPTNLFKLFWYTAQKTQYFASKSKGGPLQREGTGWYVRWKDEKPILFDPPLWQGEATPVQIPTEVPTRIQEIADALIPHALKAVAGIYRLFWFETHPYDDFNVVELDPSKWDTLEFVREIRNGKLVSKVRSAGPFVTDFLTLRSPAGVTSIQARVTVQDISESFADLSQARLFQKIYNDGSSAIPGVGDIGAQIAVARLFGSAPYVRLGIFRCSDTPCTAFSAQTLFVFPGVVPIIGQTLTLSIAWDGALVTFGVNNQRQVIDPSVFAPIARPTLA